MFQRVILDRNGRLALIAISLLLAALGIMAVVLGGEVRRDRIAQKAVTSSPEMTRSDDLVYMPTETATARASITPVSTVSPSPVVTPTLEPYIHVVQQGEMGLDILLQYGYRSLDVVGEIMALNSLDSFNNLQAGTTLLIPRQTPTPTVEEDVEVADLPTPTATSAPPTAPDLEPPSPLPPTPTETVTPDVVTSGALEAHIDSPQYLADGRWAEVMITIRNIGVEPTIQTGFTYVTPNPDGGTRYVTLLDVIHKEVPQAVIGDAPLWIGTVKFSDGKVFEFPAGCFYVETVEAHGWEPIGGEDGFHWDVLWTGGFFDCGNSTHKIPPPIAPGQTATIPLYVYMQHPRLWLDHSPPDRRILRIEIRVVDGLGNPLGTVAVRSWE